VIGGHQAHSANYFCNSTRSMLMNVQHRSIQRWALAVAALSFALAAPIAHAVTIDMVTVGNPGNANDTTGYGAVGYSYQIAKYDVTIGQYTEFLNAVAATDTYSLYADSMSYDENIAGIRQNGTSGSYTYSVIGSPNRPITTVTWWDAARFANWMSNGQGNGSTENGTYNLSDWTSGTAPAKNLINPNTGAAPTFYIPTENEWYKAAYYSPNYGGVGVPGYYAYATQSDSPPGNNIGSTANQANYFTGAGLSVTQSSEFDSDQNYLTDVGAFSGSGSFYGTFDQTGNVEQWNDLDGTSGESRGFRGGYWYTTSPEGISSSNRSAVDPDYDDSAVGFRLASPASGPSPVPEIDPAGMGSVLALVTGALGLLERRRLKSKAA
jgi:formylglycine-generating enzyme required for sulfatase activity